MLRSTSKTTKNDYLGLEGEEGIGGNKKYKYSDINAVKIISLLKRIPQSRGPNSIRPNEGKTRYSNGCRNTCK